MNIGEVARVSGVSAKMIRYYESVGLIRAVGRTDSGYRQYTEADLNIMHFIRRSRDLGFSLVRIKTLLDLWQDQSRQSVEVKHLADQHIYELDVQITKLISIRDQLSHLSHGCNGNERPQCPILDELAQASTPSDTANP